MERRKGLGFLSLLNALNHSGGLAEKMNCDCAVTECQEKSDRTIGSSSEALRVERLRGRTIEVLLVMKTRYRLTYSLAVSRTR